MFALATEQNQTRELMQEIQAVQEILKQNPELDKLMKHPGIPKQEKTQVLENVFKGRVSDVLEGFLELIVTKERYGDLQAIFDYFIDKVKESCKVGVAYVTTAIELNEVQKAEVLAKLIETTGYRTMEMHYDVAHPLIGGMQIRVGDRVVDSSIRSKLNALTKQLLQIQLC